MNPPHPGHVKTNELMKNNVLAFTPYTVSSKDQILNWDPNISKFVYQEIHFRLEKGLDAREKEIS